MRVATISASFLVAVLRVNAYSVFQEALPNGANVAGHPGLGHVAMAGGGARNTFGNAFASAGALQISVDYRKRRRWLL